jgi:CRISPR/Cas system-associated exonuclease Cas4 (RecB family)
MNLPKDFDFTQSNLQDYVDCPYRFYLRYILCKKWPALVVNDAADFERRGQAGARFHRLIQQYLLGIPVARLDDLVAADPNPDLGPWWENFLRNVPPWLEGVQFVETTLSTVLGGERLLAKYDLVLVGDRSQIAIFDWKTAQKRTRKDWLLERIQTRLYRFVLTQAGQILIPTDSLHPEQVTINFWFAPHPETLVALPYSQDSYNEDQVYFKGLIEAIHQSNKKSFIKTSNLSKCRYCVYRSHCARGAEAGDLASFEDFSEAPEDFTQDLKFEEIAEIEF